MSTEASSVPPLSATGRTTLRRHRERGKTGRADLYAVLDAGLICHLGVGRERITAGPADDVRPRRRHALPARFVG